MKQQYSEHVIFVFALFGKKLPKKSSGVLIKLRQRLRQLFALDPVSQVDVAIRNASKLSLKVSKSLNISQSPQLDEEMQDQVKELLLSFLQKGRRIAESSSKPIRRKRELIRSLLRKTVEELNKSLNEINGRWLEGYGHVQNEIMKPGLLTKQHFIDLFNEFVKNDLICQENKVDALSIKSVFLADGHNNRIRSIRRCKNRQDCSFRLSVK